MSNLVSLNTLFRFAGADWTKAIVDNGVADHKAIAQFQAVADKVSLWVQNTQPDANSSCYFPQDDTLPFSAELIYKDNVFTVITHLNKLLGAGNQSEVTSSIVCISVNILTGKALLKPGTSIVNKVLTNKRALLHEESYTLQCTGALHVRQLVAACKDRVEANGLLLIGMQKTLSSLSSSRFCFEYCEKIAIAKHLLAGLAELKCRNIVHRDLHMANCGLSYANVYQIHDLGCAATEGQVVESPVNLAVAHLTHLDGPYKVSTKDDMWALGLILYEIEYRKKPPFLADSVLSEAKAGNRGDFKTLISDFISSLHKEKSPGLLHNLIIALLDGKELGECMKIVAEIEGEKESEVNTASLAESTSSGDLEAVSGYIEEFASTWNDPQSFLESPDL